MHYFFAIVMLWSTGEVGKQCLATRMFDLKNESAYSIYFSSRCIMYCSYDAIA